MFKGSIVALVTPMHADGTIDKKALSELIEWHIASKTNAISVVGSTGEASTLDADEQFEVVSFVVKQVAGRVPVIAGAGGSSTKSTLKLVTQVKKAGADACLIVTPYYNKPTQEGLYTHFKTIADQIDMPIILYNVPSRTACDMEPETVERLAKVKHIIAIKEATGKIERAQDILKRCGKDFVVFSGDDASALDLMKHGASGVISVTANIAPQKMAEMCQAALKGDLTKADQLNRELSLLHHHLFLETNPIPTKWALHSMGKIEAGIRLPLLPLDKRYHHEVKEAMQNAGVK